MPFVADNQHHESLCAILYGKNGAIAEPIQTFHVYIVYFRTGNAALPFRLLE